MSQRLSLLQDHFTDFLRGRATATQLAAFAGGISSERIASGLEVYRNAYSLRLTQSLGHDFPVTVRALSQDRFADLTRQYILDCSPSSPNIRNAGAQLSAWLREHAGEEYGDLAGLEWAVLNAFDGPDAAPLNSTFFERLSPGDWPALRLEPVPTLSLLVLRSNAGEVWKTQGFGNPLRTHARPRPETYAVIWRLGDAPRARMIERQHYAALKAMRPAARLDEVCERLQDPLSDVEIPIELAKTIKLALKEQWLMHSRQSESAGT